MSESHQDRLDMINTLACLGLLLGLAFLASFGVIVLVAWLVNLGG